MKFLLSFCCFFACCFTISAQEYSRVKIDLSRTDITEISALGLEADHGIYKKGSHLINDFSRAEIQLLSNQGIAYEILIADVQAFYLEQNSPDHNHDHGVSRSVVNCDGEPADDTGYNYVTPVNYQYGSMGGYKTYAELLATLDQMAAMYPNLITVKQPVADIRTHEDRPIYWLRVSDNPNVQEDEPEIFYNALHHAREANSLSQMVFYLWYLLENYETNDEVKYLVDNTQMYFMPCVNPDGYVYNEITNPNGGGLWRKNRRLNDNGSVGVDLNRNYGFNWGFDNSGSSPNANSETYRGTAAFSEPETQATSAFANAHNFRIALNYHTFGNLLVYPWGYNDQITPDHATFTALTEVMTRENNFFAGTGEETVGYQVNGDSDDWMYGEDQTKPSIFSMTPEVGSNNFAFWPPQSASDELNKSCMLQNLTAAHLLLNYGEAKEINGSTLLSSLEGSLEIELKKYGLETGELTLRVYGADNNVTMIGNNEVVRNLVHLETITADFSYLLSDDITSGTELQFVVEVDNGGYIKRDTINKQFLAGQAEAIFADNGNELDNWNITNSWTTTTATFVSSPSSYTESPNGEYPANADVRMTLSQPIDLSTAAAATLRFSAKWNIEANYDYTQVLASSDGVNFTALCGNYTSPGVNFQPNGEPVFEGSQNDWVIEEMDLTDFIGQPQVWIRFHFASDGGVEDDGFYFDDLSVETINAEPSSTNDLANVVNNLSVFPNPFAQTITARMQLSTSVEQLDVHIINALGQRIKFTSFSNLNPGINELDLPVLNINEGIYYLEFTIEGRLLGSRRIVKVN